MYTSDAKVELRHVWTEKYKSHRAQGLCSDGIVSPSLSSLTMCSSSWSMPKNMHTCTRLYFLREEGVKFTKSVNHAGLRFRGVGRGLVDSGVTRYVTVVTTSHGACRGQIERQFDGFRFSRCISDERQAPESSRRKKTTRTRDGIAAAEEAIAVDLDTFSRRRHRVPRHALQYRLTRVAAWSDAPCNERSIGIAVSGALEVAAAHPPAAKHRIEPLPRAARVSREE